jgi:hypothetical protein
MIWLQELVLSGVLVSGSPSQFSEQLTEPAALLGAVDETLQEPAANGWPLGGCYQRLGSNRIMCTASPGLCIAQQESPQCSIARRA